MTDSTVNSRVQRHRQLLRAAGLRPVQMWVADTRQQGFAAECRRQSQLVARADAMDAGLLELLDEVAADTGEWKS